MHTEVYTSQASYTCQNNSINNWFVLKKTNTNRARLVFGQCLFCMPYVIDDK